MALKTLVSHWTFALGGVMGAEIRLDEQCRNVVENELKAGVYNVAELTQAGTLVTNVETAYQRADIVRLAVLDILSECLLSDQNSY